MVCLSARRSGALLLRLAFEAFADAAIPAAEVPARASFTRRFVDETQILQREQTGGSPGVVLAAYSVVIAITVSLLVLLAWSLHRLSFGPRSRPVGERRRRPLLGAAALPVFAPAVLICAVLAFQALRGRNG